MSVETDYHRYLALTGSPDAAATLVLAATQRAEVRDTMTPPEIARRLKKSPEAVLGWIRAGHLKASNLSRGRKPRYVVTNADLDVFLKSRQTAPAPPRTPRVKIQPTSYKRFSA